MKAFLTFCLFYIFIQGSLGVGLFHRIPEVHTAPTTHQTEVDSFHEFEKEIHQNITELANEHVFLPPTTKSPVHVKLNTYIRQILGVKNMEGDLHEMTVDLILRHMWNDKRLTYDVSDHPNYKYFNLYWFSSIKNIWRPDTFFAHSVKAEFHDVPTENELVWIYPNGNVLHSKRITVTVRCELPEKKELVCPLTMASYGYTTDKLMYEWDAEEPVEWKQKYHIPHFTLAKVTTEGHTGKTKIGDFSTVVAKLHFTHE